MKWVVDTNVVWLDDGDEVQLYDTTQGVFQTLNATGTAIWRQLVALGDTEAIVSALAEEFGVVDDGYRTMITTDTAEFIADLAGRGIICQEPSVVA